MYSQRSKIVIFFHSVNFGSKENEKKIHNFDDGCDDIIVMKMMVGADDGDEMNDITSVSPENMLIKRRWWHSLKHTFKIYKLTDSRRIRWSCTSLGD